MNDMYSKDPSLNQEWLNTYIPFKMPNRQRSEAILAERSRMKSTTNVQSSIDKDLRRLFAPLINDMPPWLDSAGRKMTEC